MKVLIDGQEIDVSQGQSILAAALGAGIYIPHLCYHPDLPSFQDVTPGDICYRGPDEYLSDSREKAYSGCGLCLVEVKGEEEPVLSCITHVEDGMEVAANTLQLEALRKENLVSILTRHPHACLTCAQREGCSLTQCSMNVPKNERCCPIFDVCELRKVAEYIGIKEDISRYIPRNLYIEEDKPLFLRDYNLCVGCLRCVRVCRDVIGAQALEYVVKDDEIIVGTTRPTLEESGCLFCGVCVEVCPTGALRSFELIQQGDRQEEARQEASRDLRCDLRFRLSPVILPPKMWLELTAEVLSQVPEAEGTFQLLDGDRNIIYIAGTPNLRQSLQEQLSSRPEAKAFNYAEDPMYTKRESELIQQYLQKNGHLPPGNEDMDDLF